MCGLCPCLLGGNLSILELAQWWECFIMRSGCFLSSGYGVTHGGPPHSFGMGSACWKDQPRDSRLGESNLTCGKLETECGHRPEIQSTKPVPWNPTRALDTDCGWASGLVTHMEVLGGDASWGRGNSVFGTFRGLPTCLHVAGPDCIFYNRMIITSVEHYFTNKSVSWVVRVI